MDRRTPWEGIKINRESTPNRRLDRRDILQLPFRLTDRDRLIAEAVYEHRVLTTDQLCDLAFTGQRSTEQRLRSLLGLRILDRFRPHSTLGTIPFHWTLGAAGAALIAGHRNIDVAELGWRPDNTVVLATNQRLAHLVGTNGIFTALTRESRHRGGCRLELWWSEHRCAVEFRGIARPDGYGIWMEGGGRTPFHLEYDRGTERLARLAAKLPGYERLATAMRHKTWILFRFHSERREAEARRVLGGTSAPVATAVTQMRTCPADAIWLPLTGGTRRRLAQLVPVQASEPRNIAVDQRSRGATHE